MVLPVFDYGNYYAVDTEGTEWPLAMSEDSLPQLTVPGGYSGAISVRYREPLLWRVSELVSLLACVGLAVAWLRARKREKVAGQQS